MTSLNLPDGFLFIEEFLSVPDEEELLALFRTLPFETFMYKGYPAKRRVIAYGLTYDFTTNELSETAPVPEFLLPVRRRAGKATGVDPDELVEALLTEYTPGAQISWHRDLPMFETVVGISVGGACTFRLKSYRKGAKILSLPLPPRSLYLMSGPARWQYQHSIPPVNELRYSITFRTLRR